MKKRTVIIIALCVLVAAVIALSLLGVIEPQESTQSSFAGWQESVRGIPSMP